jgi:2-phospho-L-lactate guanylyltransferase (CobY/MobA/RfbA family)
MTDDVKKAMLETVKQAFVEFINKLITVPASLVQKQQAFFRLDEGHMWMQNAICNYAEPEQAPESQVIPPASDIPLVAEQPQTEIPVM